MKQNLVTVRNYALFKGQTESYIHRQAREGKLKVEYIDDVRFVVMDDENYRKYNELKELRR